LKPSKIIEGSTTPNQSGDLSMFEFTTKPTGQRVNVTREHLPDALQELYDADTCPELTTLGKGKSVRPAASFIALDDIDGKPRRLKVSRISQWNRDLQLAVYADGEQVYEEITVVDHGPHRFVFAMSVADFDKLIESAGGSITKCHIAS